MKKIRIIQIGLGHDHAGSTLSTIKALDGLFELCALVVLPEEQQLVKSMQWRIGNTPILPLEEALALPDLDAAAIETVDASLTEYALRAAERGLHLQMDKPGSVDHEAFVRLAALQKKNGKLLHLGYMYRYNPAVIQLLSDIREGKLGEIYRIEAQMNCRHGKEKRAWLSDYPHGMMHFLGCHLIDLIYTVLGTPDEVIPLSTSSGLDGVSSADMGFAVLRYPHAIATAESTAVEHCGFARRQLVVYGSRGTAELKPLEEFTDSPDPKWDAPLKTGVALVTEETDRENLVRDWKDYRHVSHTPVFDRYRGMLTAFAEMVRGERENPYSLAYELSLHKLLLAACGMDIDYRTPDEI